MLAGADGGGVAALGRAGCIAVASLGDSARVVPAIDTRPNATTPAALRVSPRAALIGYLVSSNRSFEAALAEPTEAGEAAELGAWVSAFLGAASEVATPAGGRHASES